MKQKIVQKQKKKYKMYKIKEKLKHETEYNTRINIQNTKLQVDIQFTSLPQDDKVQTVQIFLS